MTSSERRVQRVRKAIEPPGGARDDIEHPRRPRRGGSGGEWSYPTAEAVWDEVRRALADARWDVATRASRRSAASSGRARRRTGSSRAICTAGCGPRTRRARGAGAVLGRRARAARRPPRRRLPAAPHDRPPPRLLQHRGAVGRVPFAAAARGEAIELSPGGRRPLWRRRRRARARWCRGGGASWRRSRIDPGLRPGPRLHGRPLPRRRRRQPAHHRGDRPQVGDVGVQGTAVRVEPIR